MCGGGSPPPPPDYTPQKNQIAQATEARYAQQANEYNTAVNNYNNALRGYQGNLSTLGGNIGGMSMASLWDNPNTAENENMYDKYMGDLNNLSSSLGSMSFDMARPNFSSTVNSAYGPVGITNIPSLNNVNSNLYNQLYSNASSLTNQLNSLKQQREAETNRINDFRTNMMADLSGYGTTLGQEGQSIEVVVLDAHANISSVKVVTPHYYEYLHLAKIEGCWVILNALYERRSSTVDRDGKPEG